MFVPVVLNTRLCMIVGDILYNYVMVVDEEILYNLCYGC